MYPFFNSSDRYIEAAKDKIESAEILFFAVAGGIIVGGK